ncbi:MAG: cytochrome b/b6 domain-containing protein [Paracoccaceae bacterium]
MTHRSSAPGPVSPDLWDPLVRMTHWGIALAVILNALLTRPGGSVHVWVGWGAMGLLLLRLLWGLVGTAEARFSAFPPNPIAALRHLAQLVSGRPEGYLSHNPAGAMMAYALWAMLTVVIVTGLLMARSTPWDIAAQEAAVAKGDWSAMVKTEGGDETTGGNEGDGEGVGSGLFGRDVLGTVHGTAANLMLVLAALHVAGVVVEGRAMRRNLVRPMLLRARADRSR